MTSSNAPQVNPNKLYVGNLPYRIREEELRELFSQYGEVTSATVITDKMSGRSKGFGFVEMATEDGANQAVEALNGTDMDGRALVVNVARPLQPREDRPRFGGQGGGGGHRDFRSSGPRRERRFSDDRS
ncbi:MAG TPA: RNA-binding protein [Vitreimonas sp.]|nr:RNA-binding protein [Vitreimonas sp.]